MCFGQSIFHKGHGERRPSRFDPQRRRSARPQARTARALGGRGDATNSELLFAGGYAACFENPLLHVSRDAGHRLADDDINVVARIDLGRNETGGFVLAAALAVTIARVDHQSAERLVREPMPSARTRKRSGGMSMSRSPSRSGESDRSISPQCLGRKPRE
jgi:organic hydroperoxide reductase OsmC/OhrA